MTPEGEIRRQGILAAIHAHPGSSMRALGRATGVPMGTLVHHVGILRRRGLVETVRMVSQYLIYATGEAAPSAPIGKALADPDLRRLLAWLAANPGHPQRAVLDHAGAAWGWPRSTTQHRLRRLVQAGLVAANRGVRTLRYVVAPRPAAGMAPTAPGHLAEVAS